MTSHIHPKPKKTMLLLTVILLCGAITGWSLYTKYINRTIVLEFGTFAGTMYDVPDWQSFVALDAAIEKFQKANPRIVVNYKSGILRDDYSERLAQDIIKSEEPDIFTVLPGDFNTFASIGELMNLDSLIKKDIDFDLSKQYNNAIKSGKYQSSQFALAKEVDPELMFVNKTLLKEQGIQLPSEDWTWKEFYEICKKVTMDTDNDGKIDQFGQVGFSWQKAVYTNGQQLFDLDGSKAKFNDEHVIEALKFVISLNKLNQNFIVNATDFDNSKVAFSPFPFSTFRAYKVYPYKIVKYGEFEWECIKLPKGPEGNNSGELNSLLIGISSRTKHKKEAWKFLKFLTNDPDIQMDVLKYSHGMPVLKDVVESYESDKELSKYKLDGDVFINKSSLGEVVEQSIVTPRFHKYDECMDIADKEIFQLINGGKDVDLTMSKLNTKINNILKE